MKNYYARLDEKTHRKVKALARLEGRSMMGLIRIMLALYIEWKKQAEKAIE